jgi:hypothetical protein
MRDKLRQLGMLGQEIPPPVAIAVLVVFLVTAGWLVLKNTELRGARNPPGTPGNVDPYWALTDGEYQNRPTGAGAAPMGANTGGR